jgi:hypothetical protein
VHRLQKPGDVKRRATSANDARRAIKTTRPVQSYSNSARLMMWGRFSDGFWTSASSAVTLPTMKKLLSFSSTIAGSGSFINPGHDVVTALAFSFKSFAKRSISAQNFQELSPRIQVGKQFGTGEEWVWPRFPTELRTSGECYRAAAALRFDRSHVPFSESKQQASIGTGSHPCPPMWFRRLLFLSQANSSR